MTDRTTIRCECGHFKTSHYDSLKSNRVGCHAVFSDGTSQKCKCLLTQSDVASRAKKQIGEK